MAVKYDENQKVDGTVALVVVLFTNAIEDLAKTKVVKFGNQRETDC